MSYLTTNAAMFLLIAICTLRRYIATSVWIVSFDIRCRRLSSSSSRSRKAITDGPGRPVDSKARGMNEVFLMISATGGVLMSDSCVWMAGALASSSTAFRNGEYFARFATSAALAATFGTSPLACRIAVSLMGEVMVTSNHWTVPSPWSY